MRLECTKGVLPLSDDILATTIDMRGLVHNACVYLSNQMIPSGCDLLAALCGWSGGGDLTSRAQPRTNQSKVTSGRLCQTDSSHLLNGKLESVYLRLR